jgi:uncharacterized OB-fold protein
VDIKKKNKIPIKEGIFTIPSGEDPGNLIGSRCLSCNEYFHPVRVVCANLYSENLENIRLSRRGKIFSYTIARTGYPGAPVTPPFVTAQIELPERIHVLSLISDIDLDNVKIGDEVELSFWKTGEDDKGNEIMAYAFRPVSAKG